MLEYVEDFANLRIFFNWSNRLVRSVITEQSSFILLKLFTWRRAGVFFEARPFALWVYVKNLVIYPNEFNMEMKPSERLVASYKVNSFADTSKCFAVLNTKVIDSS